MKWHNVDIPTCMCCEKNSFIMTFLLVLKYEGNQDVFSLPRNQNYNNQDYSHSSRANTNCNPLPVFTARFRCPHCRWRGWLEPSFYTMDVCANSCFKIWLIRDYNVNQYDSWQHWLVPEELAQRLLHVERYLKEPGWVARVTRQKVDLISCVEIKKEGPPDDTGEIKINKIK